MNALRVALTLMLCAATLASAAAATEGPAITRVPFSDGSIPLLACSTIYGCEVIMQTGERLRLASLMDDRWSAKVEDAGSDLTAPRILIMPAIADQPAADSSTSQALRTSLHAYTDRREYVVDLRATAAAQNHRLAFTYPDAPAVIVRIPPVGPDAVATAVPLVAPQSETPPLDPARMDFGWKTTGDTALRCIAVFSYRDQLWCRLPSELTRFPLAYYPDGSKDLPLTSHPVAQRYLVIDGVTSPVVLVLGGAKPQRATIVRAHE